MSADRDLSGDAFGEGKGDLAASGPDPDDEALCHMYPEVAIFARAMRLELWRNRGKGGRVLWRQETSKSLVSEVFHHVAKLAKAVRCDDMGLVLEHAADVGNTAMHVADALYLLDDGVPDRPGILCHSAIRWEVPACARCWTSSSRG